MITLIYCRGFQTPRAKTDKVMAMLGKAKLNPQCEFTYDPELLQGIAEEYFIELMHTAGSVYMSHMYNNVYLPLRDRIEVMRTLSPNGSYYIYNFRVISVGGQGYTSVWVPTLSGLKGHIGEPAVV